MRKTVIHIYFNQLWSVNKKSTIFSFVDFISSRLDIYIGSVMKWYFSKQEMKWSPGRIQGRAQTPGALSCSRSRGRRQTPCSGSQTEVSAEELNGPASCKATHIQTNTHALWCQDNRYHDPSVKLSNITCDISPIKQEFLHIFWPRTADKGGEIFKDTLKTPLIFEVIKRNTY